MAFLNTYWRSYEHLVKSLPSFMKAVRRISAYEQETGSQFVWRGVAYAAYPLYSSLVRHYIKRHEAVPDERRLREFERSVFREAQDWNLDWYREGGRLTALEPGRYRVLVTALADGKTSASASIGFTISG